MSQHAPYLITSYRVPVKRSNYRDIWRDTAEMVTNWRWLPLDPTGTFYDNSQARSGYLTEEAARRDAEKHVQQS